MAYRVVFGAFTDEETANTYNEKARYLGFVTTVYKCGYLYKCVSLNCGTIACANVLLSKFKNAGFKNSIISIF